MALKRTRKLSRSDVAKRLGVAVATVRRWENDGTLSTTLDERGWHVFDVGEVDALARSRTNEDAESDETEEEDFVDRWRRERQDRQAREREKEARESAERADREAKERAAREEKERIAREKERKAREDSEEKEAVADLLVFHAQSGTEPSDGLLLKARRLGLL